ncbi:MAG: hypothetical protein UHD09_05365 [Bifidobacterium sp.]|nr:hypothetical protein [Bifidobacterium sp.]
MKEEMPEKGSAIFLASAARQMAMIKRCLEAESHCRRHETCVYALGTALQVLGVSYLPDFRAIAAEKQSKRPANGKHRAYGAARLGAELLQVAIAPDDSKPKDHHPGVYRRHGYVSDKPRGKRSHADQTAYFVSPMPLETTVVSGVTCTSAPFTWFMLAQWLSLEELVVLGDAMMQRNTVHEGVTIEDFEDVLARAERYAREQNCRAERDGASQRHRAARGIAKCRKALALMVEGTDSPMETRVRLLLERYGLPRPIVNLKLVLSDRSIVFLDIAFKDAKVDVEYDGEHHREQWQRDADRRLRIEADGWAYVQITKESWDSEEKRRRVAALVATRIEERTGINWLLDKPLPLERVPDRRRKAWRVGQAA